MYQPRNLTSKLYSHIIASNCSTINRSPVRCWGGEEDRTFQPNFTCRCSPKQAAGNPCGTGTRIFFPVTSLITSMTAQRTSFFRHPFSFTLPHTPITPSLSLESGAYSTRLSPHLWTVLRVSHLAVASAITSVQNHNSTKTIKRFQRT